MFFRHGFLFQKELQKEGIESFGVGPDHIESYTNVESLQHMDISRKVRAVVVSFDIHLSYSKIMRAANYINQPTVRFYATNPDPKVPGPVPGKQFLFLYRNALHINYRAV